jgi:hypothetical protein
LTATEPRLETALAVREFSQETIRRRADIARESGFGLQGATQAQLNAIILLAYKYDLDPLSDITLYRERPYFTIDGRVRLMRRHPEYRGYVTRPLTATEKEAWGYQADEIVVECTIHTRKWGDISARGKVRPSEYGSQPVAKSHPQEMAEKRAIARASRMAFGQDVPDEDTEDLLAERDDPERVAANSAEYVRIFGDDSDTASPAVVQDEAPVDSPSPPTGALVESKSDPLWQEWLGLERQARVAGFAQADTSAVKLPLSVESLRGSIGMLREALETTPEPPG